MLLSNLPWSGTAAAGEILVSGPAPMSHSMAPPEESERYRRSNELLRRALELIPGGAQTGSKAPDAFVQGAAPTHLVGGEGCRVRDPDGNEYVDHPMARGAVVLGHGHPDVVEAVETRLAEGIAHSLPHPLQTEVAERIVEMVPCAEMVRFGKNGNDATTLAAKLARAYTGRNVVATQGYHGWSDVFMARTDRSRGIPTPVGAFTAAFQYGDVDGLRAVLDEHTDDVAAVVVSVPHDDADGEFLAAARDLADDAGALFVLDEVITGFRWATGGAQEYHDVTPDLAVFGKALANGHPLSALAGPTDIMAELEDESLYFSLTNGGETASLAAARACLDVVETESVPTVLHRRGRRLREGYNDLAAAHGLADVTEATGVGPTIRVGFADREGVPARLSESLFMQEALARGVLYAGVHHLSAGHDDAAIEETLSVYDAALGELAAAREADAVADRLDGAPIGTPLRERSDEGE
jgi:glutamate-1-semialdehyde aminotransferase